jgi:sugar (pentulose or hexulose) kinase
VGEFQDVASAARSWIRKTENILPSAEASNYRKYYSVYQTLYPKLKETFSQISALGGE